MNSVFDRLSDVLGVQDSYFESLGVLNRYVHVDMALYIDPFLLKESGVLEFQRAEQDLQDYFEGVIKLIAKIEHEDSSDLFWRKAHKALQFKEINELSLGFGFETNHGRGIGPKLAKNLVHSARKINELGIEDTQFFHLIGLFEEGISLDLVSDMIAKIILPNICRYSARIAVDLGLKIHRRRLAGKVYDLACYPGTGTPVLFLPKDILSDLPVAFDWSDIDRVCIEADAVRSKMNELVATSWKRTFKENKKTAIKSLLLNEPGALKGLVEIYKNKSASSYDFKSDPLGLESWAAVGQAIASEYDLSPSLKNEATSGHLSKFVAGMIEHFKHLIEFNGLEKHLYKDDGLSRRKETYLQLLFNAIAITYSAPFGIKVSREVNMGRGPVDFQFSHGSDQVAVVEMKFADNSSIEHGWDHQLPIYQKACRASHAFYVVVKVNWNESIGLERIRKKAESNTGSTQKLVVINGTIKRSASYGFFTD